MRNHQIEESSYADIGWSNAVHATSAPVHRWYVIKEAFSPRLVQDAIDEVGVGAEDLVVDPFCGSGTVPLTASLGGYRSVGFEVNPFLAFVSRAKMDRPNQQTFSRAIPRILEGIDEGRKCNLEQISTFSRSCGREKWLFNTSVLRGFEGAWQATARCPTDVRNLLRLSLIGAAMDSCNASVDGKCLRYKKGWQMLGYGRRHLKSAFLQRADAISMDLLSVDKGRKSVVLQGDCRSAITQSFRRKFRLCVTSPPYLNSFDYTDIYRPELFLGKFVGSTTELRSIRFGTVRSHVQVDWARPTRNDFGALYHQSIAGLRNRAAYLWNPKIPVMVQAYFEDMHTVLTKLRERAQPDASLWLIVSTSAYAGIEIPVDLIIGDIGSKAGWFLQKISVLRFLRSAGQHWHRFAGKGEDQPRLRESVIMFGASKPNRTRQY
jgi:hypothetical protein